jgi:hypothetical protein
MMTFRTSMTSSGGPFGPRAAPFQPIFLLIGMLAVWQLLLRRNRRLLQPKWLTACAILTIVFLGIGCASGPSSGSSGSGSSQTTPPGTYSVTVTGSTSGAGAQSESVSLSIIVTP